MRFPYKADAHNISFPPVAGPALRASGGDFYDLVLSQIEAAATGTIASVSSSAAIECVAGLLSRCLADAEVEGAGYARDAVTPCVLSQIGRDLIIKGETMHVIDMVMDKVNLTPASTWHFEGGASPESWTARATMYGPSTSITRLLPWNGIVFVKWGARTGAPYQGVPVTRWASTAAKLQAESEKSLADESAGPLAQLISIPQDGGDGEDSDPLKMLKSDVRKARGATLFLETVTSGWGEGRSAQPLRDWMPSRLGPAYEMPVVKAAQESFARMLAAYGLPPGMFSDGADGTSQLQARRTWYMNTVRPLARIIEGELTTKLETPVRLKFDGYPSDIQVRAQATERFVRAGFSKDEALRLAGVES